MSKYRTHTCGELRETDIDSRVSLAGWIHRKRDHGNLLFIDLRDHYGITQCVIESGSQVFSDIESIKPESVVNINGLVISRDKDAINTDIPSGSIEVKINEMNILSSSNELPLQVFGELDYPEDTRLRYRYLDLRRERLHKNITLRSKLFSNIRKKMELAGFNEFQTPILTSSSPEGARDFLVPSRLHPGNFYALPQAPQIFKQLIMVSGFDKYFQLAPCFRDEDPRADRSPGEFYQLDIEMSFVEQEDIFLTIEPIVREIFNEFSDWRISDNSFQKIPYKEAILKYGVDKPDLRIPIEISDVTKAFEGSSFKIFSNAIEKGAVVRAIPVPGGADQPRSFFDKINEWSREKLGAAGLGYIIYNNEPSGPIAKNLTPERNELIKSLASLKDGDAVFFACDREDLASSLAGSARIHIANKLNLFKENVFDFCWITEFPLYEYNKDKKSIDFAHNPFSMPKGGLKAFEVDDPLKIKSFQYDLVCNGTELASGAIRNHLPELMLKSFGLVGYKKEDVKDKFGALYDAFHFGCPPHGGLAFGIERMMMLLANEPNLREVILFPMNQKAEDILMSAPAKPSEFHLSELKIKCMPDKD
ncbi:aspartate--tRNA ligase [Alphaproteobacteria bacterium]|nr:aspartate--tRNA ligase [Alphaproteobacteria bacterium]